MRQVEQLATARPMRHLTTPRREPTPVEAIAIREVHDLAWEFASLPPPRRPAYLAEVRKLTTGRQRFLATAHTPPDDPAFAPLMAMLDALIAEEPVCATKHGVLTDEVIREHHARIEREGERTLVCFPVRWPWHTRPDRERGVVGIRGDPLYRRREERGPVLSEFRVLHEAPRTPDQPWWED